MIGLERHKVLLVDHQPQWTELFESESDFLHNIIGDLVIDIQHVGSTAVPDLPAKPILDIAVAVRARDIPAIVTRLVLRNYVDQGDQGRAGGHLVVKEIQRDVRTAHLHIVDITDEQWCSYLNFRDRLRGNATLRKRYAALKRNLAKNYAANRELYTSGKNEFIQKALGKVPGQSDDDF